MARPKLPKKDFKGKRLIVKMTVREFKQIKILAKIYTEGNISALIRLFITGYLPHPNKS